MPGSIGIASPKLRYYCEPMLELEGCEKPVQTLINFIRRSWPIVVVPVVLLGLVVVFQWSAIERNIAENARQALAQDFPWAGVENYRLGRKVLLTGEAPSQSSATAAENQAAAAHGVSAAKFIGSIAPELQMAKLHFQVRGTKVLIEGTVADVAARNAVIAGAIKEFGSDSVFAELATDSQTADIHTNVLRGLLKGSYGQSADFAISFHPEGMVVEGELPSENLTARLERQLHRAGFDGEIIDQSTKPELIENNVCQDQLNNILSESKINFASGRSVIQPSSYELLETLAGIAVRCPSASFEVAGHTDSTGNADANLRLSQLRADRVVDFFGSLGLDANRFQGVGYGAQQPLADNETRDGRAANRRIEFKLRN
ncbi:MAG: OmpA family protein [Gammaproteobacteria bacterium]|nr:OmpA family protein [Gammaproteobacteria bacterium]